LLASKHIATTPDYDNPEQIRFAKYSYEFFCVKKLKKLHEKNHKKWAAEIEKLIKLENGEYNEHYNFWMKASDPKNLRYEALYELKCENNEVVKYLVCLWKTPRKHTRHKDLIQNTQNNEYTIKPYEYKQHSVHGDHGSKGQRKWKIFTKSVNKARKEKHSYAHLYPDPEYASI
jgi:hypothetical protein